MKGNSSKFLALLLSASMIRSPTVSVLADTQEKAAQTESSAAAEEAPQSEETAETAEPETTPAETESSESTAETPAEPINGLILFLVNKFINFASNTPPALPMLKAKIPMTKIANVWKFKNAVAVVVAPTEIPKNIVQIFINSF